jgi:hypothetical protein
MNIIFKEYSEEIAKKYTVLDLDTFSLPDGTVHTACCVVENIPIDELSKIEAFKSLHAELIESYGKQDWDVCTQAIEQLVGKWGGELDTFYEELQSRIQRLTTMDLPKNWSPVIPKT